jgi:carotenoid cleavage dioxygenase-like enzyme
MGETAANRFDAVMDYPLPPRPTHTRRGELPCYVFHPLNAYDDGDNVVLKIVRHPTMFDRDFSGPNEGPSILHRWTVDLNAGKVREDQLGSVSDVRAIR